MQYFLHGFDFSFHSLMSLEVDNLGSALVGFGVFGWKLSLVFYLFVCLCCLFFLFDFSGNAKNGGSDIVRLGGLIMDKMEIACLFPLALVLA